MVITGIQFNTIQIHVLHFLSLMCRFSLRIYFCSHSIKTVDALSCVLLHVSSFLKSVLFVTAFHIRLLFKSAKSLHSYWQALLFKGTSDSSYRFLSLSAFSGIEPIISASLSDNSFQWETFHDGDHLYSNCALIGLETRAPTLFKKENSACALIQCTRGKKHTPLTFLSDKET